MIFSPNEVRWQNQSDANYAYHGENGVVYEEVWVTYEGKSKFMSPYMVKSQSKLRKPPAKAER